MALQSPALPGTGHVEQRATSHLDSGDLAYLSINARKILDEASLQDAVIVASNDLDETVMAVAINPLVLSFIGYGVLGGLEPLTG